MAFYQFKKKQVVKATIEQVWDFISRPENLKKITPDYMGFNIIGDHVPKKMYSGMIISYMVSPMLGIKTNWVTEITHIREKKYFVDEQRVGPYKIWHHQHHIEETDDGVLMTDIISYNPPFGFLGRIANSLFIKKKLNEIFEYRTEAVIKEFG